MSGVRLETWDAGRLQVNVAFADLLRSNGLTSFQSLMNLDVAEVTKDFRRERITSRVELFGPNGRQSFYIKRFGPSPLKEYLKPLIRLRWPKLGARPEWEAILRFHEAGIPTMEPVALGISGQESCLLTAAIEGCTKISAWMEQLHPETGITQKRPVIQAVAQVARQIHGAGMHHQDFYAGHLMLPADSHEIRVLDLGRVRYSRSLARHWIIKDLAQLLYSTSQNRQCTRTDRLRFLRSYLGRRLAPTDRGLMRQVAAKSRSIARHSRKHAL